MMVICIVCVGFPVECWSFNKDILHYDTCCQILMVGIITMLDLWLGITIQRMNEAVYESK